jgi:hypothetical protein
VKNVLMPDGTVIRNVPDGMDAGVVMQLYAAKLRGVAPSPQLTDSASGSAIGAPQAAAIAMGQDLDRTAAGVRQLAEQPHALMQSFGPLPVLDPIGYATQAVARGIGHALDATDAARGVTPPSIDPAMRAADDALVRKVREEHPVATTAGDLAYGFGAGGTPAGQALMAGLNYGTPEQRVARAATTYLVSLAAQKLGEKAADAISERHAQAATKFATDKGSEVARDKTLDKMEEAGFVVPPSQANPESPGAANRVLEGFSGKIQTQQQASIRNQPVVNAIAARELGLPGDAPITVQALEGLRKDAGKAYDAVAKVGAIKADPQFNEDLGRVAAPYLTLKGSFPNSVESKQIEGIVQDLTGKPAFDSGAVVNLIRYLRSNGYRNLRAAQIGVNPQAGDLGAVQLSVQRSLEDLIDRNLQQSGQSGLLDAYRAARTMIAKSYNVQNALEESTGKVLAGKLAKQAARGAPLTGGLKTIADAATAFPKAFQNVNSSMPGLSPLDMALSLLLGEHGFGVGAAIPFLRPGIRSLILSHPYQAAMVYPGATATSLMVPALTAGAARVARALPTLGGLLGGSALRSTQ